MGGPFTGDKPSHTDARVAPLPPSRT